MNLFERVFDVPGLDAEQIEGGLYIGSIPPKGYAVKLAGFDTLVLCAKEYQPPASEFHGVNVIHVPFNDIQKKLEPKTRAAVLKAAAKVTDALEHEGKVLVTCQAGMNRSGLVCGLALINSGMSPEKAIERIQARRTGSLFNQAFVDMLRAA